MNAMVRRALLLGGMPFHEVAYSEDMLMAQDDPAAGLSKDHAGCAVVKHSNVLTLSDYSRRTFDESSGLRSIGAARWAAPSQTADEYCSTATLTARTKL